MELDLADEQAMSNKDILYLENCLNQFKDIRTGRTFHPKLLKDGLIETLTHQDWDSSALLLEEMSRNLCKANERAIWKAGMYLGLVHPKTNINTIDIICESAFHFCETLRSEITIEHMIYYMNNYNFQKALEIAEMLDKPKRGVKKKHENPVHKMESYRNRLILDIVKYYKAMAELGYAVQRIYTDEGQSVIIPTLLGSSIQPGLNHGSVEGEGGDILVRDAFGYEGKRDSTPAPVVDNNPSYTSMGEGIQITSILDKWMTSYEETSARPDTLSPTAIQGSPDQATQGEDFRSEISSSFFSSYFKKKTRSSQDTPRRQNASTQSPTSGKKRKLHFSQMEIDDDKLTNDDLLSSDLPSSAQELKPDYNTKESESYLMSATVRKRLNKVCQSFENCLSSINFTPESPTSFPEGSLVKDNTAPITDPLYVAWEMFVDLHVGVLVYLEKYGRAKQVIEHFVTLYPNHWVYREMAVNFHQRYRVPLIDSDPLIKSHLKILISKDPTNHHCADLCQILFNDHEYIEGAYHLFDFIDRTTMFPLNTTKLKSQMSSGIKIVFRLLEDACRVDPALKVKIDSLWLKEDYRAIDWVSKISSLCQ